MTTEVTVKADSVGAAAVYPYTAALKKQFTHIDRFKNEYTNYKIIGKGSNKKILLPRAFCPEPKKKRDQRSEGVPAKIKSHVTPRDEEQARVIDETIAFLKAGESGIVQAVPGFGKTVISMAAIAALGRKTCIVITKDDLKRQWIKSLLMFTNLKRSDIGVIQGSDFSQTGKKVVIAMVHSLSNPDKYPNVWGTYGLVIFDEVHRIAAEHFSTAAWLFPARNRLGLSATPTRRDGKNNIIRGHIGPTRVRSKKRTMVPLVIRQYTKFKVPLKPQPVTDDQGRTHLELLQIPQQVGRTATLNNALAQDPKRNKSIIKFTRKAYRAGRKIILFSHTRKHLDILQSLLIKEPDIADNDITFYVGGLTEAQQLKAAAGRVLLSTYKFASEGTDIPDLDTGVFVTPVSSLEQIAGRIMREHPNKEEPILFDLIDDDSWVLTKYSQSRLKFYTKIGARIVDKKRK